MHNQPQISQNTANQFLYSNSSVHQSGQKRPATSAFFRLPKTAEQLLLKNSQTQRKRIAKLLGKNAQKKKQVLR